MSERTNAAKLAERIRLMRLQIMGFRNKRQSAVPAGKRGRGGKARKRK